ncbi:MAG: flagellar hook-associated protein FlgK [Pseudomonadota bacterium]
MSVGQALSNALSGLSAAGRRASVTANNIANAQTEGFAARRVDLAERVTAGVGAGVEVAGVQRAVAPAVTAERRIADAELAGEEAAAEALSRIVDRIGDPEDARSLVQVFGRFERALSALANTPDDGALQSGAVRAANGVAGSLNALSNEIQQSRVDADARIERSVEDVNNSLRQIERLNASIASGAASNADVNALIDERARLIDRVNQNIPVRAVERGGGVDLVTAEGVFLLSGTARQLSFKPSPVITPQNALGSGLSGLEVDGVEITPGAAPNAPQQGALAGLFSVRDQIAPSLSAAVDAVALDVAERFSGGIDATIAFDAPGLFTDAGALATEVGIDGLAGRFAVNAAVDPENGGEARRLRDGLGANAPGPVAADGLLRDFIDALREPRTTPSALGASRALNASEAAAFFTSSAAGSLVDAEAARDASAAFAASLQEAEIERTGVDTDAELQNLLTIEQAYAANARVIQTVDRLLQTLLEI